MPQTRSFERVKRACSEIYSETGGSYEEIVSSRVKVVKCWASDTNALSANRRGAWRSAPSRLSSLALSLARSLTLVCARSPSAIACAPRCSRGGCAWPRGGGGGEA
eukprot:1595316-Pleurochrysis_carterae.AAC.1